MKLFKLAALALSSAPAAVTGFGFNIVAPRATSPLSPTAPAGAFVSAVSPPPAAVLAAAQGCRHGVSCKMMAATTTTTTGGDASNQQSDQAAAAAAAAASRGRRTAGMKVRHVSIHLCACMYNQSFGVVLDLSLSVISLFICFSSLFICVRFHVFFFFLQFIMIRFSSSPFSLMLQMRNRYCNEYNSSSTQQ